MRLIANKPFPYGVGKSLRTIAKGETFDTLTDAHGIALLLTKVARRPVLTLAGLKAETPPGEPAEPDPALEPRKKRAYRRRDLTAES